jgi:four helix bundle protein
MRKRLDNFRGYAKSRELFENVVADLEPIVGKMHLARLVSQQIASADSICANIEEGYGRGSKREFAQFLIIARGSARETRGRYERMARWLSGVVIEERTALCDEILGILTATIKTLRST